MQPVDGIRGIWPARNAARVNGTGTLSGLGNLVVYTVPAGKRLFISSLFMTIKSDVVQAVAFHAMVRDGDDNEQYRLMSSYMAIAGQDVGNMSYLPALELEAGWDVYITLNFDNSWVRIIFSGWLEDA